MNDIPAPPAGVPPFVVLLPQRAAAFKAMRQFATSEGIDTYEVSEEMRDVRTNTVGLVGTFPSGRKFVVGYEWTDADFQRYVMGARA